MGALLAVVLVIVKTPDLTVKEPFSLSLVRKTIPELDLVGFSLFAPAVIMILLALQWGGTKYAWSNSVIIGLFCGGAAGAAIFIFWERRQGDRAMVPGSIVKQRIVWSSAFNGMSLMTMMYTASQFLPIYFQAIKGEDPAASGVDVLPSILSQLLTVVGSGALLQRVGYYMPFAIVSSVISAIGNGLVSTYNPWTETARWAGYQFFLGAGRGIGMQIVCSITPVAVLASMMRLTKILQGLVAMQNVLTPDQIPAGLAFLVFCQNMAAAVFVVVGTVVFTQSLVSELAIHAPSVNPEAALAAGASASAVRALVPAGGSELDGVLVAFSNSFDRVFYLLVGCSIVGFVSAFGMGWINIRKKKVKEGGDA